MQITRIFAGTALALLLGACAGITAAPEPTLPSNDKFEESLVAIPETLISKYYGPGANQRAVLDEFFARRFAKIDLQFTDFLSGLTRDKNVTSILSDLAVIGLTGAIATGLKPQTAQTLGAFSTIIAGGEASYDENIFINETLGVLKNQMIARRDEVRARIATRLAAMSSSNPYPLVVAQGDLHDYYHAGTIRGAIEKTAKDAGDAAADAAKKVDNEVFDVEISQAGTDFLKLMRGGRSSGLPDATVAKHANDCAAELKIAGWTDITASPLGAGLMIKLSRAVSRQAERDQLIPCINKKIGA